MEKDRETMIQIYAHRGDATHGARQNGMEAFEQAALSGCHGIETDLRHTADGRVAVFHDHAVRGKPVYDMTLGDLRALVGHDVPTIEDLIAREWTLAWNLEIKTREAWSIVREMRHPMVRGALVTSFIHEIAWDAASLGIRSGLLVADSRPPARAPQNDGVTDLVVFDWKVLDEGVAEAWKTSGWTLGTYGTEGADEHGAAIRMGAKLLITDHPARGLAAIQPS